MPSTIPTDRATVAAMTADDLDALTNALAAARTLVDDVRDERAPQSFCGQWDHPGHHWTRHGRPRYCSGDGPGRDRETSGKCGARWPHPAHDPGDWYEPCPGVADDAPTTDRAARLLEQAGFTTTPDGERPDAIAPTPATP